MNVQFICDASAVRSHLAVGLARARFGDRIHFTSASAAIHPMTIEVLRERWIELEPPSTLSAPLVISLGPAVTGAVHWPISEPDESRHRFRRVRREITARLDGLEAALALPAGATLRPATDHDRAEVEALLAASALPLEGLDDAFASAVVCRVAGVLAGVAMVEVWDDAAVLRSVAVAESFRRQHVGEALVADRVAWTQAQLREDNGPAIANLFLLTTSAESYFKARGFQTIPRDRLAPSLSRSTQTKLSACSTAIAMRRHFILDRGELFAEGIATELAAHGTLLPPWEKYPDIPRYSIGWRMGYGEWYLWLWSEWYARLSETERAAYQTRWVPPGDFEDFYSDEEEELDE